MTELDRRIARRIIESVGGSGTPPEYGFQHYTAGLDRYLSVIDDEYLESFLQDGGAAFKMVVGVYGGGKTHFLYCVRDHAWHHNFAVAYVALKQGESPFHRLDLVYGAIARSLLPPLTAEETLSSTYELGIGSFIRRWYAKKDSELRASGISGSAVLDELTAYSDSLGGVESLSFLRAVKAAFHALATGDEDRFESVVQWLSGEGYDSRIHKPLGILQRIDKSSAFSMLRSLAQWIREIGYTGLIVLLDEAERIPSLATKQRELHLSNLRELIDECGQTAMHGTMVFYAVPDENFLDGRTQVYQALKQRVATVFDEFNPTGVKVELGRVVSEPLPFLCEVGQKLAHVYEIAYEHRFADGERDLTVERVAEFSYGQRWGDTGYMRLFVQKLVPALHKLRQRGEAPTPEELSS
jgi:hypothetical protein